MGFHCSSQACKGAHIAAELGAPARCTQIFLLRGMDRDQWGCAGNYLRAGVANRHPFVHPGARTANLYPTRTNCQDACLQGGSALQENTPTGSCHVINHPKTLWLIRQSFYFLLYLFARAAVTKYHESRALNNKILLAHSSGGWEPRMRVWAGQSPAEAMREAMFQAPQVLVACQRSLPFLGL